MKVIIAGGRDFSDYETLSSNCDRILQNVKKVEIISGRCSGADELGERYARERGYKIKLFPAQWGTLGRKAGPIRNKQMAEYSDALIAFWDGESKGTGGMIGLAEENGLQINVVFTK